MLKNILLLPMLALLVGCASTVNLSPQAKSELKTINVSQNVAVPVDIFYYGQDAALMGAAAGMLLDTPVSKQLEKEVPAAELKAITVAAFKNALSKTRYHAVNGNADATMTITIKAYGFDAPFMLSKTLKPQFNVVATLTNKNNQTIWKQWALITALSSNTPSTTETELLTQPEKLRSIYKSVAEMAANRIVSTLN